MAHRNPDGMVTFAKAVKTLASVARNGRQHGGGDAASRTILAIAISLALHSCPRDFNVCALCFVLCDGGEKEEVEEAWTGKGHRRDPLGRRQWRGVGDIEWTVLTRWRPV